MEDATAIAARAQGTADPAGLLAELIRFDTSNPPGNEQEAQEFLFALLEDAGFECRLLAKEPGRPNLVARLTGKAEGLTLCLLGHIDTVPADPGEWRHDPWSGELIDDVVWGRGALDMKGQVASEVAAVAALAASGWRPERGALQVVVAADEERGGGAGARWLCEERPDDVRCDIVVNEGGGAAFEFGGRRFYTLCVGEKGVARFRIVTHGVAAHASLPAAGDNALLKLAPLLERLADSQPPPSATPDGVAFLEALLGPEALEEGVEPALARVGAGNPFVEKILARPMLGITMVPTMAAASRKDNVVPSRAEVLVDCRVPPGVGTEEALAAARALLGDDQPHEVESVSGDQVTGTRSPFDGPVVDTARDWLAREDPDAALVPMVLPGFSDSHWFRAAFGARAYGFFPHREMPLEQAAPLVHSADERVPVADLELATRFYRELVQRVVG